MATREDYYDKFGPKVLEAIVLVVLDEVNAIRANASLTERTVQQMLDAIDAKIASVGDYAGMSE